MIEVRRRGAASDEEELLAGRARSGRPSAPLAFVLAGPAIRGWEPGRGLVKVLEPSHRDRPDLEFELSIDGRTLRSRWLGRRGPEYASTDVISGIETLGPELPRRIEPFQGIGNQELWVEQKAGPSGWPAESIYRIRLRTGNPVPSFRDRDVVVKDGWIELPTRDLLSRSPDGQMLQYSADGSKIVISQHWPRNPVGRAIVVNLNTGTLNPLRFGFTIAGSAVWSPDNRHLLGHQVDLGSRYTGSYRVTVYDLLNDMIVPVSIAADIEGAICAGWYTSEQILMYTERQRVLTFHTISIVTGERHEVNAIRLPSAPGFQARVRLAASVLASRTDAITPV